MRICPTSQTARKTRRLVHGARAPLTLTFRTSGPRNEPRGITRSLAVGLRNSLYVKYLIDSGHLFRAHCCNQ
jgi:hypothetical protein